MKIGRYTPESHQAARDALAGVRTLLEQSREHGPLRDVHGLPIKASRVF